MFAIVKDMKHLFESLHEDHRNLSKLLMLLETNLVAGTEAAIMARRSPEGFYKLDRIFSSLRCIVIINSENIQTLPRTMTIG